MSWGEKMGRLADPTARSPAFAWEEFNSTFAVTVNLDLKFFFSFFSGHLSLSFSAIMLKRITRFTPPEVIVGLLAPYVRISTSNVRIMKNKAGRMGQTYGFIELDSHAVSSFPFSHLSLLACPADRSRRNTGVKEYRKSLYL